MGRGEGRQSLAVWNEHFIEGHQNIIYSTGSYSQLKFRYINNERTKRARQDPGITLSFNYLIYGYIFNHIKYGFWFIISSTIYIQVYKIRFYIQLYQIRVYIKSYQITVYMTLYQTRIMFTNICSWRLGHEHLLNKVSTNKWTLFELALIPDDAGAGELTVYTNTKSQTMPTLASHR